MNLHYSQTIPLASSICRRVLYLYEFTLLSNYSTSKKEAYIVLYLYEFTLLSNCTLVSPQAVRVLYLYEFTLLSNEYMRSRSSAEFYTSMNLHYSQTHLWQKTVYSSFIPL